MTEEKVTLKCGHTFIAPLGDAPFCTYCGKIQHTVKREPYTRRPARSDPREIEIALEASGGAGQAIAQFYEAKLTDLRKALETDHEEARLRIENTATLISSDIETLESLSDAAMRSGDTQTAIAGYALALRLRSETGLHPQRRSTDA